MARPSIINDLLIDEVCSLLRRGVTLKTAIQKTNIGQESYYRWERNVRKDRGTELECRFIDAVNLLLGQEKLRGERALLKSMDTHSRCATWWLERKYPGEYGKRRPPPLSDPDGRCANEGSQKRTSWEVSPAGEGAYRNIATPN